MKLQNMKTNPDLDIDTEVEALTGDGFDILGEEEADPATSPVSEARILKGEELFNSWRNSLKSAVGEDAELFIEAKDLMNTDYELLPASVQNSFDLGEIPQVVNAKALQLMEAELDDNASIEPEDKLDPFTTTQQSIGSADDLSNERSSDEQAQQTSAINEASATTPSGATIQQATRNQANPYLANGYHPAPGNLSAAMSTILSSPFLMAGAMVNGGKSVARGVVDGWRSNRAKASFKAMSDLETKIDGNLNYLNTASDFAYDKTNWRREPNITTKETLGNHIESSIKAGRYDLADTNLMYQTADLLHEYARKQQQVQERAMAAGYDQSEIDRLQDKSLAKMASWSDESELFTDRSGNKFHEMLDDLMRKVQNMFASIRNRLFGNDQDPDLAADDHLGIRA